MKKWQFGVAVLIFAIVLVSSQGRSEYLFKKDGSIIDGKITAETAKNVTIRKEDGKAVQVNRADIMRVLYTRLYMGKVFIRLTTGKVLDGYMVEEDQETYTFRKELYRPEEFTLQRNKVMFLVRSNPTDLEAKADKRYIALKWSPPFVAPKSYKIYAKSAADREFRTVGTTGSTSYRITGLRSNTPFKIYVTAVDREDKETLPSDEIGVTTLNAPPDAPGGVSLNRQADRMTGKLIAVLSWNASADIDGTVTGYRIYRNIESGYGRLAESKTTGYTAAGLNPDLNHRFLVRAVDDRGDESSDSGVVSTRTRGLEISASAAFFAPLGNLTDLADPGFGIAVRAGRNDFFVENLTAFFETGYYRCSGSNDRVDYFAMVPLMIGAGYDLRLFSMLTVSPAVSFGYSYNTICYQKTLLADIEPESAWEPVASGGLDVTFHLGQSFLLRLGGRFGAIFESDGAMYFSTVTLGAGYVFGL